jgi:hypothetical protein
MSPSLYDFLALGRLGPLWLGIGPSEVLSQLGEPTDQSLKQSPLIMTYGPVALTFWRKKDQPLQLMQVDIAVVDEERSPPALGIQGWGLSSSTTLREFEERLSEAGLAELHKQFGPDETHLLMPSGVRVSFSGDRLTRLQLMRRDREQSHGVRLTDQRQPSVQQILAMLGGAQQALIHGLPPASLVLAWAALEAAMRKVAVDEGRTGKVGAQAAELMRELFAARRFGQEDLRFLESTRQLRSSIVHGLAVEQVPKEVVARVIKVAERLLSPMSGEQGTGAAKTTMDT